VKRDSDKPALVVTPLRDPEATIRELKRRLRALKDEAAKNEVILHKTQERELDLLRAENLPALMRVLVQGLRDSYGLDAVTLTLLDPQHEIRHLLLGEGQRLEDFPAARFVDALPGALRPVVHARRPWLGTFSAAVHADLFPMHQTLRSIALIPLVRQEHVSGLVNFGSNDSRRFTRTHATDFLAHLGIIAAVCMENAINRSRVLRSGLSDFLTGWHNRRYLETRLKEELARAHRHSLNVSCLLIDVDRFKQVNDTHGHLAGDRMLREIARRIETHIRASDTAARFGGDEFAILLAETGRAEAVKLAERIRQTVNAESVALGNGVEHVPSLSIGVATVDPAHDKRDLKAVAESLLAEADAHLYRAKAQGRNRVAAS